MSECEEEMFLTQSSFNGSINPGNDVEKLLSSKNLEEDYEDAQFSIEQVTEELLMGMKKFQWAALKRGLKQMRRKRRKG